MKICVPSSHRSDTSTTQYVLKNCIFFVPEDQVKNYDINREVIGVPFKGITKTRNFILDYFKGEDVLFIDDDVRECGMFQKGMRINLRDITNSDILESEFERVFDICRGLDFKIWGAESGGSKFANHPLNPFSFRGVINGSLMGIVNDGEYRFDEEFEVKEDYEIMLRHYMDKGGVLKCRHFYWRNYHWNNEGGCVDYRTDKLEEKCIGMLEQKYPGMIKRGVAKHKHQIGIRWV